MRKGLWRWGPVLAWMLVIYAISSIGNLPKVDRGPIDTLMHKSAHLLEYAILAVLLVRAMRSDRPIGRREIVIALIVVALYGASDEWHQSFVNGRDSEAWTVGLDTIGGVIGVLVWRWWRQRIGNESANARFNE